MASPAAFRVRSECVEKWISSLFEPLQQWRGVQSLSEELTQRMTFREYCRRAKNWFDQRKLIVYQTEIFPTIFSMAHQALVNAAGNGQSLRLTLLQVL